MEETKKFPELTILQDHFRRLLERGERESATGALHHGLHEIAEIVASHPEMALKADALLAAQDAALAGYVGVGNGRAVALILNRVADEIRPAPESNGFNRMHRPAATPAPRRDIPTHNVEIAADGRITFTAVPASEDHHG